LKLLLFCAIVFEIEHFCHKKTEGFALQKIFSRLPYTKVWEISPFKDKDEQNQVRSVLSQPYTYLGKGAQCYAFLSQDKQYVLKFCRFDHLRPPFWAFLPLPSFYKSLRDQKMAISKKRIERTFTSYCIAYEKLKEETGLVAVHLNPGSELNVKTSLIDKLGIVHQVWMDQVPFILQKRADLVYPKIDQMMQQNQNTQSKQAITDLISLIVARCQKEVSDKDPDIPTNFGFIDNSPVQIDIGRFSLASECPTRQKIKSETIRITDKFHKWLKSKYPELADHLQAEVEQI
jgi:hypothetical protein